ncbi:hypothetical protein COFA105466_04420 [Corynebacterium falsenii]
MSDVYALQNTKSGILIGLRRRMIGAFLGIGKAIWSSDEGVKLR